MTMRYSYMQCVENLQKTTLQNVKNTYLVQKVQSSFHFVADGVIPKIVHVVVAKICKFGLAHISYIEKEKMKIAEAIDNGVLH